MSGIVLCGPKHCGKSTLGRELARLRGCNFADTDAELEKRLGESCRAFYRRCGREAFERAEAELLRSFAVSGQGGVTALGGGTVSNPLLADFDFGALGVVVFLDVDPDLAFERILRGGLPPFLESAADPRAEFGRITALRRPDWLRRAQVIWPVREELSIPAAASELDRRIREFMAK